MAHIQTVLGPIEPAALGFTLPHEHTQIALWHIQNRWDYWQLTRDEPVSSWRNWRASRPLAGAGWWI